jgi:hypothetical protein
MHFWLVLTPSYVLWLLLMRLHLLVLHLLSLHLRQSQSAAALLQMHLSLHTPPPAQAAALSTAQSPDAHWQGCLQDQKSLLQLQCYCCCCCLAGNCLVGLLSMCPAAAC